MLFFCLEHLCVTADRRAVSCVRFFFFSSSSSVAAAASGRIQRYLKFAVRRLCSVLLPFGRFIQTHAKKLEQLNRATHFTSSRRLSQVRNACCDRWHRIETQSFALEWVVGDSFCEEANRHKAIRCCGDLHLLPPSSLFDAPFACVCVLISHVYLIRRWA